MIAWINRSVPSNDVKNMIEKLRRGPNFWKMKPLIKSAMSSELAEQSEFLMMLPLTFFMRKLKLKKAKLAVDSITPRTNMFVRI